MKKYAMYIGVLILFFLLVTLLGWVNERMVAVVKTHYRYIEYQFLVLFISYILIGLFIGAFHFVREIRKAGNWKINKEKLIAIGIPLFLLLVMINLYFFGVSWPAPIGSLLVDIANNKIALISAGVLLGYVAITSFYKSSRGSESSGNEV